MNEKSLKTLEYEKVKNLLEEEAVSEVGKDMIRALRPSSNPSEVRSWVEDTDEGFRLIITKGNPPLYSIKTIKRELKRASLGGSLSPEGLLKVATVLRGTKAMKKYAAETKDEEADLDFHGIEEKIMMLTAFDNILRDIEIAIVSEDEISDDASLTLKRIRREIRKNSENIKVKLNSIITSEDNKKYLQDAIFTMREGRYVVPVKSANKGDMPGLVHDMSGSGQTLFIEPMAVVELNNKIRELELEERREIERILAVLSSKVGDNADAISLNEDILTNLDFIFAKAKLAIKLNATKPVLNSRGIVNLSKARHPLLESKKVVPIDVRLGDGFDTLVITGPNTGGKTVSLKTMGLLHAMAQSGLFIPAAENSEVAIFNNIYADIGDEQSIEQSLSTFSSHMVNIVSIIENAVDGDLVLFDELGAGTDPTEGAVLAISILEKLREKDVRIMATTHYNQLKVYAMTTENVENASMEFNIETLSPTYRLLIGIPGKSNAFEISRRLGLSDEIIDNAKNLVEVENIKFEDMLSEIEKDNQIIEKERREAEKAREEVRRLEDEARRYREKTEQMRERILNESREEARDIIRNAREESRLIIDEIREISKNIGSDADRRITEAQDILRSSEKRLDNELQEELLDIRSNKNVNELKKGDSVKIPSLNQEGTIVSDPDPKGNTLVQVGIMKMNIPTDTLVPIVGNLEKTSRERSKVISTNKAKYIKREIDIRGKNVDEAIMILDKYLDDAYIAGLDEVYVIHGKGTGALKEGLKPYFKKHKLIKSFKDGEYNEGGAGVSVLKLK